MATDHSPPSPDDVHEEVQAALEDYHAGALPADEAARVKAHLDGCEGCRAELDEVRRMRAALSGMGKASAPAAFPEQVAETIHRRSAGRFFARRTLGDRVPFGVLLIVAMVVLVGVAAMLWGSSTGSLKIDRPAKTAPAGDGAPVVPEP